MTPLALHSTALAVYIVSAVLYGANLTLRTPQYVRYARILFIIGFLIHTCAIGATCAQYHQTPFATGFGTLSFTAWTVAALYLPVELAMQMHALGALALPMTCILMFGAFMRHSIALEISAQMRSSIISIHILLTIISFALFALAACSAGFYVWQSKALKRPRKSGLFRRLPPLDTLDALSFKLVAFGLPLLTLGLALGIVRAAGGGMPHAWETDPHTLISLVSWGIYAAYLYLRLCAGWRGIKPNYLLFFGIFVILVLFIAPSSTHRFG